MKYKQDYKYDQNITCSKYNSYIAEEVYSPKCWTKLVISYTKGGLEFLTKKRLELKNY